MIGNLRLILLMLILCGLYAFALASESTDTLSRTRQPTSSIGLTPASVQTMANFLRETEATENTDEVVIYPVKPGIYYTYVRAKNSRYYMFPYMNIKKYLQMTFRREKIPEIVAMTASTAILIGYDQQITDETKRFAHRIGLSHKETQTPVIRASVKLNGQTVKLPLNFPSDGNTILYFLGDGITHSSIAGGLWIYGTVTKDLRAQQTGAQLVEAILTTGTVIQILKHSTGRESAAAATEPRGRWVFFPSLVDYGKHVPKYDAYPTGHLATAMATVTIIADNYPEKKWIRPFGYTLMTACGFAMVNNGVHWASDYPLGISIGYTMAKITSARGKTVVVEDPKHALKLHKPLMERMQAGPKWKNDCLGFGVSMNLD